MKLHRLKLLVSIRTQTPCFLIISFDLIAWSAESALADVSIEKRHFAQEELD